MPGVMLLGWWVPWEAPVVTILKDGLGWVIQTLVIPVIEGMVDNFNTLITNLQTGYNWIARLVPGLKKSR